jgi:AbrB family looped-hinge helix DNA binding protein
MPNSKIIATNLTIDKSGRIVVLKPVRDRFGLTPNTELQIVEQADGLLLKRVEERPSMIKIDGLWVHQGVAEPGTNWDRVVDDAREERIDSILKA